MRYFYYGASCARQFITINPQSAIRNPQSLLSFNALRAGFDILQRLFSLLNFLFGFAADVLVNFERRRQIDFELPHTFLLGLAAEVARLLRHSECRSGVFR